MVFYARVFLFLMSLCLFSGVGQAQSSGTRVDILPRKILIDDKTRSGEINVMNMGQHRGEIRISVIAYRQDEMGQYQILDKPLSPDFDPEKLVRFSPKQFTLPPQGRQKVRISVQRPATLPDGEYRFHVKAMSYDVGEEGLADKKGQAMEIKMNLAVVIPVVVRKGVLTSTARIENVRFNPSKSNQYGAPTLDFDIIRTGQAGVMGIVDAYWDAAGKEPEKIARLSNVNVFAESPKRHMQIPLNKIPEGAGTLRLTYSSDLGEKGIIDEVVLQQ